MHSLVDDNSDPAVEVGPTEGMPTKVVRHVRNLGPGGARNTGMAHANGKYVVFLDDDDRLHPDRIKAGVDDIGDAFMHSVSSNRSRRAFEGDMRKTLQHGELPSVTQVLFRRSDLVQFDTTLRVGEDIEWWIRMTDRAVFSRSEMVGLLAAPRPARAFVPPPSRRQRGAARGPSIGRGEICIQILARVPQPDSSEDRGKSVPPIRPPRVTSAPCSRSSAR